jgi:hypothetical protein
MLSIAGPLWPPSLAFALFALIARAAGGGA